jgi:hypothetical protein
MDLNNLWNEIEQLDVECDKRIDLFKYVKKCYHNGKMEEARETVKLFTYLLESLDQNDIPLFRRTKHHFFDRLCKELKIDHHFIYDQPDSDYESETDE